MILPFTVLRRLDCVLEPTKEAVLAEKKVREGQGLDPDPFLWRVAGQNFCNTSAMGKCSYIQAFTPEVRDIFERFEFHLQVNRPGKSGLLYMIAERFAPIDLHPETVNNAEMGLVVEGLIRKFAELSNETAGEHFTPIFAERLSALNWLAFALVLAGSLSGAKQHRSRQRHRAGVPGSQ